MSDTHESSPMPLSDEQQRILSLLADMVIPPSDEYQVPGAGDETICRAIIQDAGRRLPRLLGALSALEELSKQIHGVAFDDLSTVQRQSVAQAFRQAHPDSASLVEVLTTQCYYRDDRVMISLDMPPRPPHPVGFEVEQGDWSLLDPVRSRIPFHRKTR